MCTSDSLSYRPARVYLLIVAAVLAAQVLIACGGSQGVGGGTEGVGGGTEGTVNGGAVVALADIEIEITNAVAPFDHNSNADSLLMEMRIAQNVTPRWLECLASHGYSHSASAFDLPDRDSPILMANAAFPDIERLASEGFPLLPGTAESDAGTSEVSAGELAAVEACSVTVGLTDAQRTQELFGNLRGAWQDVLDRIDAMEEVHELVSAFGVCLQDEGIPGEYTIDEVAYLSYVDFLLAQTGDDLDAMALILHREGQLYVACGRDLFEARERLRSGELRTEFLRTHEAAIRSLSVAVYGGG